MSDMSMSPDPSVDAAPVSDSDGDNDSNERTVCISCTTDPQTGKMTYAVGLKPDDDDSGGDASGGGDSDDDDSYMQPVQSLVAAFSAAKDLLTNPNTSSPGDEAAFTSGYDSQSGRPPTLSTSGMK